MLETDHIDRIVAAYKIMSPAIYRVCPDQTTNNQRASDRTASLGQIDRALNHCIAASVLLPVCG